VVNLEITGASGKKLVALTMTIVVIALFLCPELEAEAQSSSEYERYVHNYTNTGILGNWTYIEKPMFPIILSSSQVYIGQNWSIVCPLEANRSYHIYFYGKWISNLPGNKTDYDLYVYDPNGTMEGYHTTSAGLPEHLGSKVDEPFFVPKHTGNYTFTIVNDAGDSASSAQATFMIIENIRCNAWYQEYTEGNDGNSQPLFNTNWAYEFVTESQHIEVRIRVPDTLDMYEARLFLMAYPKQPNYTTLDGIPLAWEPGLYGNKSNDLGGYNLDSEGYEGVAYASCENFGQDMTINLDPPVGKCLYHLVLMSERGYGNVSFQIKTTFDSCLQPSHNPDRLFPDQNATITYISKSTDLENATLQYSTDSWKTVNTIAMDILDNNRKCSQVIPIQAPGTVVYYKAEATDAIGDVLVASGNYSVGESPRSYLPKPMFPVFFNESQIQVGHEWSIMCPLEANHSYHVYCYGEWVNTGLEPKTDYDVYVYNSLGELKGYHTESAGLPEHLGTTVNEPFFAPEQTDNYTFVIRNDAKESNGAQQATFMIIEDVECNVWHEHVIEGKDEHDLPTLNTSWACEFATENLCLEVYVKVPEKLDMYEARLYLMSDPVSENRTTLNGVPLAWEPGLYGNRSKSNGLLGGYNPESRGCRGVAYASCEFYGEGMFLNFTSPLPGKSLYHLVFIGEVGSGDIEFLVKTEFNKTSLTPTVIPEKVYPNNSVTVVCTSNSTDLESAVLEYSTDGWRNVNVTTMEISNRTCRTAIPGQAAGTIVSYVVHANDTLKNALVANGNFSVKHSSTLNISANQMEPRVGENVTISGTLIPQTANMPITVYVSSLDSSKEIVCYTLEDGTFAASFKVEALGTWSVYARCNGSSSVYESETYLLRIIAQEPMLAKYSFYIFGGMGAIAAVAIVVYVRRVRR